MTIRQNLRRLKRARGPMKKANIIKHFFFFFEQEHFCFDVLKDQHDI